MRKKGGLYFWSNISLLLFKQLGRSSQMGNSVTAREGTLDKRHPLREAPLLRGALHKGYP